MFVAARPPMAYGTGFLSDTWTWYVDRAQRLQWLRRRTMQWCDCCGSNRATQATADGSAACRGCGDNFFQLEGWLARAQRLSANGRLIAWAHRHPASRKSLHAAYGCGQQNNGHMTVGQTFMETQLLGTACICSMVLEWMRTHEPNSTQRRNVDYRVPFGETQVGSRGQ